MVVAISNLFFHATKCGLHLFWRRENNWTFATPLHTLNIDSSSFGKSAHATNFAQVEHKKNLKVWSKHTKKKLTQLSHTG
jgi:hypothetical protein